MNIFGRRKSHSSHHSKQENAKEKQLHELKTVFPSIRRPNNDDTLFSVQFSVDNRFNSLRIFIPSDFPNVRPVLQVDGPVQHPWLDPFKQVNGCDKLLNWKKDSSLVEIVEECIAALSAGKIASANDRHSLGIPSDANYSNYPAAASGGSTSGRSSFPGNAPSATNFYPTTPNTNVPQYPQPNPSMYPAVPETVNMFSPTNGKPYQQSPYPQPQQQQSQHLHQQHSPYAIQQQSLQPGQQQMSPPQPELQLPPRPISFTRQVSEDKTNMSINMPPLPNSFPELEDMTVEQLERLLNDSVALQVHVSKQEGVKSMEALLEQLKGSNYDMTVRNLSFGEELDRLNLEATEKQKQLKTMHDEYQAELSAASSKFQMPQVQIMHELKKKKAEMDNISDQIGMDFADGKIPLDKFITDFLDARTKYYSLSSKIAAVERTS